MKKVVKQKKAEQKKIEEKPTFELGINMFKEVEVPLDYYKKGKL